MIRWKTKNTCTSLLDYQITIRLSDHYRTIRSLSDYQNSCLLDYQNSCLFLNTNWAIFSAMSRREQGTFLKRWWCLLCTRPVGIVLTHWNNWSDRHAVPLGHIILILKPTSLFSYSLMLHVKATNTNFVVYELSQPEIKLTIYSYWD